MAKEELEKEAGKWLRKYLLCCNCEKKCTCIDSNSYCEEQVLKAYVDSAEPREKRIAELKKENAELKKNYEDSLVACGVLKNKVELLSQPSPLESMQDTLITAQKVQNEKRKAQLTKAKKLLKWALHSDPEHDEDFEKKWEEAEQFISEVAK